MQPELIVRQLGIRDYESVWHEMQAFTDNRTEDTTDEIWLVQHPSVFTQGQAGRSICYSIRIFRWCNRIVADK